MRVPVKHIRLLIKLRMEGKSNQAMSEEIGISPCSVKTYLSILKKQYDLTYPPRAEERNGKRWTPEKLEKLADSVNTNTYRSAGKLFGVSGPRVCALMKLHTERWIEAQRRKDAMYQ